MPVWQRPSDGGGIVEGFKDNAALEESADGVDDGFGDFRKVGEGLSPDSFPLAPSLRRTAGGLERLGMTWTRMDMAAPGTWQQNKQHKILYISSMNYSISFSTWQQ